MTAERKKTAIVIGAGVGGTATAARLAYAGFDVTVLERNDFTGGRCSIIRDGEGHRFDQGPSLLLLPRLFDECFADLGTTMKDEGVEIRKCEPNYKIHFGDGEKFTLSTDGAELKKEIERFEGEGGYEGYLAFMQEAHKHYELSLEHVLHKNFPTLLSMLRPAFIRRVFELHPFQSLYQGVSTYFRTDRLRRVFSFASMYMGMSPYDAPRTYSLLVYSEQQEGIWYPLGGFHSVIAALVRHAERNGAKYRLSTPVARVLTSPDNPKLATGVLLESGEKLEADVVVVNADLIYSMNNLFGEPKAESLLDKVYGTYAARLAKKPVSCSSISFYWSIDRVVPELSIHNIFLADEYKQSFDAIFNMHAMPEEPSFYLNVPSRIDPSAAPEGRDTLVVLVPVGHISANLPEGSDWKVLVDKARDHVYETLEKRLGLKDLRKWTVGEIINDPITWQEKFNLHRGSILGLSHSFFNVLSFRPATRHPTIDRAYFVGASAHPGTGVPICLAGSKLTTDQILSDMGLPSPWNVKTQLAEKVASSTRTKVLDVRHRTMMEEIMTLFTLLGALAVVLAVFMTASPAVARYAVVARQLSEL